ncbi:MAG: glycosyltransferase family 2 protein [Phycisphaerales bacterium]|nr:MAG: glycosyltransferase family 2 protein [Phycisphaerales bacterium]
MRMSTVDPKAARTADASDDCAPRVLIGIPVYNEEKYVSTVLSEVRKYAPTCGGILVIDDGSTDSTPMKLAEQHVEVIRHAENRGYGRSMQDMMRWASFDGYDWLITMDCDEQHEPAAIPNFLERIQADASDVISGSRYLANTPLDDAPPQDRRTINRTITDELNQRLGQSITDSFCGFKAYRVSACDKLSLDIDGYDFPMQFWVQAAANGLRIEELAVRLIYNDPTRSFGGPLDVAESRLAHYRATLYREIRTCADRLPATALEDVVPDESVCTQR